MIGRSVVLVLCAICASCAFSQQDVHECTSTPLTVVGGNVHDFGVVELGAELVTWCFELKNDTHHDVSILEVRSACSCTSVQLERRHLAPGEVVSGTIGLRIRETGSGSVTKTAFLDTDFGGVLLTLRAFVVGGWRVSSSPTMVTGKPGEIVEASFEFVGYGRVETLEGNNLEILASGPSDTVISHECLGDVSVGQPDSILVRRYRVNTLVCVPDTSGQTTENHLFVARWDDQARELRVPIQFDVEDTAKLLTRPRQIVTVLSRAEVTSFTATVGISPASTDCDVKCAHGQGRIVHTETAKNLVYQLPNLQTCGFRGDVFRDKVDIVARDGSSSVTVPVLVTLVR